MSQAILDAIKTKFGDAVIGSHAQHGDETAIVASARVLEVMTWLKDEQGFNMLIDLFCYDTLGLDDKSVRAIGSTPEINKRFHLVYHLRSLKSGHRVRIKAMVDDGPDGENPEIDTMTSLFRGANWSEREAFDMYGVKFRGHPDLRRILMYEEFVGYPLRKDYPKEKRQPLVRRDFT